MAQIGTDIEYAKQILDDSGVVAIPTETVYGLAGNALDTKAILEIYRVKNRPKFDPLIAHIPSYQFAESMVTHFPEPLRSLADRFWPGPLTLLLDKQDHIPDLVTSGSSRVALRVPSHPLTQKLLQKLDYPLAAPSANPFGYVSPTNPHHVNEQLGILIPYILDGASTEVGVESTIVGFEKGKVIVHRVGGLPIEQLEEVVGEVQLELNQSSNPVAPGMLKSHYSPGKKLTIGNIPELLKSLDPDHTGIISFKEAFAGRYSHTLSPKGSLEEAASKLFHVLRELDSPEVLQIISEPFPDEGLGKAINDRLRRASV